MTAGAAVGAMRALPIADAATILGGRDPLVLAPHADDESLGCGGLLAQSPRAAVLILTDGAGSHPNSASHPPARLRALREAEAREAAAILGIGADRIDFLRLADTAAPTSGAGFEAAVAAIVAAFHRWRCGVLLAPWRHDPHCDHEAAHLMAVATGLLHLAYPVWGLTLPATTVLGGAAPTGFRLEVAAQLPTKRRAIAAHRSQYAGLIDDDPSGFQLRPDFLARFDTPFETYLTNP